MYEYQSHGQSFPIRQQDCLAQQCEYEAEVYRAARVAESEQADQADGCFAMSCLTLV